MHSTTRILPAFVLGFVLAACGQDAPTPTPTPATTSLSPSPTLGETASPSPTVAESPSPGADAPEGWRRIGVAEQGFSIAVPEEWEELSPDVISDSGVMEQMLEANPDAAVALEHAQVAIESGQIALFAFDTSGAETGFATNLNVINVGDDVQGSTAEQAAEEIAEAIRQEIPIVGEVETETTTLPAGEAAVLNYEWQVDDGQGTVTTVTVSQYAIIADSGTGFILSMSAASDTVEAYRETFREIAESFREESS